MGDWMSTKIGFTGTRHGMTVKQKLTLEELLRTIDHDDPNARAAHGDCVGADAEFHTIVKKVFGFPIEVFPPDIEDMQAKCEGDVHHPPKAYLKRDRDIVDWATYMIATPHQEKEVRRSGTWATIRYARKKNKPIHIIKPDGTLL
jgi:hypothetical protein